ncbi:MAG: glycoside hydrolase family 127 protein [Eubacteriales bacterium]
MTRNISYENVKITDGFWYRKQEMIRKVTLGNVYDRFNDTGRIDVFKCDWKRGMPSKPHYFWDSDVAKWIESVAYLTRIEKIPEYEEKVDSIVDLIEKNQWDDGYFNTYFTVLEPEKRFTERKKHELYCAGHLIEAAIAYKQATGKDKLLRCMIKYADYIDRIFRIEKKAEFVTPVHEEIELALVKLYRETGEKRYLDLASFFLENRGTGNEEYVRDDSPEMSQDHAKIRNQKTAEGHAVRQLYLCCGIADVAAETGDQSLYDICMEIFNDIVTRKMYISGGLGSNCNTEGFDEDYYLPNEYAYNETCASVAMALFCLRMQKLSHSSAFADVIEREMYNGIISGVSLDGKAFFYENPLEINLAARKRVYGPKQIRHFPETQRIEVFECSCCPPNITRYIASLGDYIYSEDNDVIFVNQYVASETSYKGSRFIQETDYPLTGSVKFTYEGESVKIFGFRIPFWCSDYSFKRNGCNIRTDDIKDGYLFVSLKDKDTLAIDFDMPVKIYHANPKVADDCNRVALMRGPVLYCLERASEEKISDERINLRSVRIKDRNHFSLSKSEKFYFPRISVRCEYNNAIDNKDLYSYNDSFGYSESDLKFIPYYAFANSGESDMIVWICD